MSLRADTPWLRFALAALLLAGRDFGGYDIAAGVFHVSNGDYLFHDGKPNDGENFLVAQIGVPF